MIDTWSKFYFGFEVTEENRYLSFSEGGSEIIATVRIGRYSPTTGLLRVASAMSDAGGQTYSVTMDRITRKATISAAGPFELKISSGSTSGSSIFSLLGFSGSDLTGTNIYTGTGQVAKEFKPQFKLQDFVSPDHWKKSIDPSVKKAADGTVEVVRFGVERLMQLDIKFSTNKPMDNVVILNNPTGIDDLQEFMDWLITKAQVEFMEDKDDPDSYLTVLLERTPDSQTGTDYKLKELYAKNLPGFFDTGQLVFRVVE
jgi:hypothetical protein